MTQPTDDVAKIAAPALNRFWAKVQMAGDDCWLWRGASNKSGYGMFSIRDGEHVKTFRAHRVAYELKRGRIDGQLDHLCRNRLCCNPAHLEDVSARENTLRGFGPTAYNAYKKVCVNGHNLTGDNVAVVRASGRPDARGCRVCRREAHKRWKAKL